jgi:hypothetical protein
MAAKWELEPVNQVCTIVNVQMPTGVRHFKALLLADVHIDSKCHLDKQHRKILDAAKEANAPIVKLGDTFDAMQGPHDKRSAKGSTRSDLDGQDYFDRLVNTAADVYEPYAEQLAYIGMGNHETSVLKHSGTNLTTRLCQELRHRTGKTIVPGGYRGWVRWQFTLRDSCKRSKNMYWCHGAGGGGEMTFGTLKVKRRAAYTPDADIVVSGHIHEDWNLRIARYRLTIHGNETQDEQLHISVPSLKDSSTGKGLSWEHEKEMPPKVSGAYWLTFTASRGERDETNVIANCQRIIADEL